MEGGEGRSMVESAAGAWGGVKRVASLESMQGKSDRDHSLLLEEDFIPVLSISWFCVFV